MLNFTSRITYYLSSTPTDMRNGREGLAGIIREKCSMILIVMMKPSETTHVHIGMLSSYIKEL